MVAMGGAQLSNDLVANSGLGDRIQEVTSGIDALYLSGRCEVAGWWLCRLDELREAAEHFGGKVPILIGEMMFAVAPHGWGRYRYCLENHMGRIGFSPSKSLPAVRIQPRSEYLHSVGPKKATAEFGSILDEVCGDLTFGVSRIDLYADFSGLDVDRLELGSYLCRAKERRIYESSETLTGVEFGSRASGTVSARIYDKTLDIATKGSDWWYEVWGDRYRNGDRVWRIEYEFGRKALNEFDVDGPNAVLAAVPELWSYATTKWLSHRQQVADSNKWRWPASRPWQQVQHASLCPRQVDAKRLRNRAKAGSLRILFPGLCGYLASFGAIVGSIDIDDTVVALAEQLRNDEIVRRTPFAERVSRRRLEVR